MSYTRRLSHRNAIRCLSKRLRAEVAICAYKADETEVKGNRIVWLHQRSINQRRIVCA